MMLFLKNNSKFKKIVFSFRSPARLVDLSVILFLDKNQSQGCSDDMALFRLYVFSR